MDATVRAFGRTRFNYTATQLPANQVVDAMVIPRINVTGSKTVEIVLRFHSGTTLTSGQKVEVIAVADAYTEEDPALFFRTAAVGTATLQNSTGAAPAVVYASCTSPFGSMITLIVRITQAGTAATIDATISCDVVMKSN